MEIRDILLESEASSWGSSCAKTLQRSAQLAEATALAFKKLVPYRPAVPQDQCWLWSGLLHESGYGQLSISHRGKLYTFAVHRLSFEFFKGKRAQGLVVMHACDERRCWNPRHLSQGTRSDNTRDMVTKGRAPWQKVEGRTVPTTLLAACVLRNENDRATKRRPCTRIENEADKKKV